MRKQMNLHDLLSGNLRRLLRKNRIRRKKDFGRLKGIHSAEFLQPLHKKLSGLPLVSQVRFDFCPHTPASSFFRVRFRGTALGGMSIQISHVAPIFCWRSVPPEGFVGPITSETPPEVLRKIHRDYEKALRRKVPVKAQALSERVLDEIAAYGLMQIPHTELGRPPASSARLPKPLSNYSLAFFYFESIPSFD